MKMLGRWQENAIYISNYLFCAMCCLPILHFRRRIGRIENIIRSIIFLSVPFLLLEALYSRIVLEPIEALVFGYSIYAILDDHDITLKCYYLRVICSLSVLVLTKSPALLFVIVCWGILFVLRVHRKEEGRYQAYSVFIPATILGTWKVYCKIFNLHAYLHEESKNSLKSIFDMKNGGMTRIFIEYLKKFVFAPLNGWKYGMTAAMVVVICICFLVYLKKVDFEKYNIYKKVFAIYYIGFALYCIGHLYMYLMVFSEGETETLSSFERYLAGYLTAGIFIVVYAILEYSKMITQIVVLLLMICFINWSAVRDFLIPQNYMISRTGPIHFRTVVEKMLSGVNIQYNVGDKIAILYTNDIYFEIRQNIRYAVVPSLTDFIQIEDEDDVHEFLEVPEYSYYIFMDIAEDGKMIDMVSMWDDSGNVLKRERYHE